MTRTPETMSDELFDAIARRFRLLSDPLRLKILNQLNRRQFSVGQLAEELGTSQPNVSKHLAILRDGGLVRRHRYGASVIYQVADDSVFDLCRTVCGGIEAQLESQRGLLVGGADFGTAASGTSKGQRKSRKRR